MESWSYPQGAPGLDGALGLGALVLLLLFFLIVFGGTVIGGIMLSLKKSRAAHEHRMAILEKRKELLEKGVPADQVAIAMDPSTSAAGMKHPIEKGMASCGVGTGLLLSALVLRHYGTGLLVIPAVVIGAVALSTGVTRLLAYYLRRQDDAVKSRRREEETGKDEVTPLER